MVTIGKALDRRSDLQKRIARLEERLRDGVLVTVTEALARRDVLGVRASALRAAICATTEPGVFGRYSRCEIRMVRQVQVAELHASSTISRRRAVNWTPTFNSTTG